ncbi:FKBP-type peptidyl-prolyl cis-trans isomerase [Cecembia calidifontis]|jgi:FKBP-type peptidyl-prolyl cis-trans isomerase FklB|uniref:Peptidyl-prolyl cis-trans isomerase n=1 Tax=Cecembia calidifontis TaxID=1187080 RepID=A0A4Q7P5R5_9BACT|nr:FKBP-type peptidyl-prolyl cis-trans isomerase [Cecembia calidifontis]RZS95285.1 FKBP-type peptidyl-prolyl isomerase-like protein [Cecembia calidifontis]
MKYLSIGILALSVWLSSCISDSENAQIIFERDKQKIEEFVRENPIPSVKEFSDPALGIRIFWQEVSNSGRKAFLGDTVVVDYVGKLLNGNVFDTSIESVARANNIFFPNRPYEPFRFAFGYESVIQGFLFGISQMEEGDKATVIMPSLYGYGRQASQGIPSNSILMFELDYIQLITPEDQ